VENVNKTFKIDNFIIKSGQKQLGADIRESIAVVGAGSWGTALACILAEKGFFVYLWVHGRQTYQTIKEKRENVYYLPGIRIPDNVSPTNSLKKALNDKDCIFAVLPSHVFRKVIERAKPYLKPGCLIISATKGIENKTLLTMSGIIKEVLGDFPYSYVVLSGPSFAKEVIKKLPTAITVASNNIKMAKIAQKILSTQYLRVYTHHDVLGVELGGALKNVMAIAAGVSDGLNLGHNARAALITRGLAEIMRLGKKMGADTFTFSGLSGLGDLILTCTSPLSRNYMVGYRLGKGEKLKEILSSMRMVAEGVKTTKAVYKLSLRYGVEMPVTKEVYAILYKDKQPYQALETLLSRRLKEEFS